jgi:hypothetical protein
VLVFDFSTVEDWNALDKMFLAFEDFHDALLKGVSFFTAAYVDEKGTWYEPDGPYHARLLFQSQSPKVKSLELIFLDVKTITMDFNLDFKPSGTVEKNKVVFSLDEATPSRFIITAKQLKYKLIFRA